MGADPGRWGDRKTDAAAARRDAARARLPRRLGLVAIATTLAVLASAIVTSALPQPAARAIGCAAGARSWLVPFATAPFPYDGEIPGKGVAFLDQREGDRRGHTAPRGGIYWESETYSDSRVLLSVPRTFDPGRPGVLVVYLHGNLATIERDVCRRQGLPRQIAASGLNAVLIAPQFAVNALDSSAGAFWRPNAVRNFLGEAADKLSWLTGQQGFENLPVVIVAYSGGYLPAIFAAEIGGIGERLRGIVLMDALFGEGERFAELLAARGRRLAFVSAYSGASRAQNAGLKRMLDERGIAFGEGLPAAIRPGSVTFLSAPPEIQHGEFMTRAFAADPLKIVLGRLDGSRTGAAR